MKNIYVTQPFLPPLTEYVDFLEKIWSSQVLTNNGEFHKKLEGELEKYFGVSCVSLTNNGTSALVLALEALNLTGSVITTPFTFIATSNSLVWRNLRPIFVDITSDDFNIDTNKIQDAIEEDTSAILAVHCYGNPCDVDGIFEIASDNGLKVIYDAAHAFGVKVNGKSLLSYGDLSTLSFHATKVFNTFEGGCVISHSETLRKKINNLKNFGIINETEVVEIGLNAKLAEPNAAFGLLQFSYLENIFERRKMVHDYYSDRLLHTEWIKLPHIKKHVYHNYSYYPVRVINENGKNRDFLYEKLRDNGIIARKYFYPLVTDHEIYKKYAQPDKLEVSRKVADEILCLPIHTNLSIDDLNRVISVIKNA